MPECDPADRRVMLAAASCVVSVAFFAASTPQSSPSTTEFVAFRFDDERAIATVKVADIPDARQIKQGLSAEPMARFGYSYADVPETWHPWLPTGIRSGDRWLLHTGPGQVIEATAERVVAGNAHCRQAFAVLLRVAPDQARAFASRPDKYFIAEQSNPERANLNALSSIGVMTPSPLTPELRREMESILNDLFERELPRVRADAAPGLARMATSEVGYHRSWARERQEVEEALARGRARLDYDVQAFRLSPDQSPVYFVRASWLVGRQIGFAASLWVRSDPKLHVVETDLRPASWLRMFMFQGRISRGHLGLILNVLDRDADGWGEVLFARTGYEGVSIDLLEYSPSGLEPTGTGTSFGC
jgi:hypothetical protein